MERRKFFRNFALGSSLLLTTPVLFNACSDDTTKDGNNNNNNNTEGITVDLTDSAFATLKTVDGFAYKGDIIIIRSTDTIYIALSKVCTHQACVVAFNSTNNDILCPCHGSKFSISGTVINGPATSSLKKYDVKLNGNILTIT